MARPRSPKVIELKEKLIQRIEHGYYQPGSRFLSNRALGQRFAISYQTADTLLRELVAEGYLFRKPGSGTYLRGEVSPLKSVDLVLNERAKRKDSFGALLRDCLVTGFDRAGIAVRVRWDSPALRFQASSLPVFWECQALSDYTLQPGRYCLLINQSPPKGLSAVFVDAVSVDDHSGGIAAGELAMGRTRARNVAVLAGPKTDQRCLDRVRGFLEIIPQAKVFYADSWFYEDGLRTAAEVLDLNPDVVFCANDRLAQALLKAAEKGEKDIPKVIGFDDAPIAEQLNLSTIAMPWMELATNVVEVVQKRLGGDTSTAISRILAPRPVLRATL
jgi:DNA-binding transcriptional regulator YhcF (GntR family)